MSRHGKPRRWVLRVLILVAVLAVVVGAIGLAVYWGDRTPPEAAPSATPSASPTADVTPAATGTPTVASTQTAAPTPAATATPSPGPTASPSPTAAPTASPAPATGKHVVAIDAGHQLHGNADKEPLGPGASEKKAKVTSGTTGRYTGVPEYQLTLKIALKLRDELAARGYEVVMIRETHDVDLSNAERAQIANESGAEVFLRIHANGSDDTSVRGALTMAPTGKNPYVSSLAAPCKQLSQCVIDRYCQATGFKNRGIQYTDGMSGINWCKIPVTIVEMGFMSNEQDDRAMQDPAMQKKMARGIADGVDAYFAAD